jgi:hypothetical protein
MINTYRFTLVIHLSPSGKGGLPGAIPVSFCHMRGADVARSLKSGFILVGSANVSTGAAFGLAVAASGSSDLYAFQFDLSFNPSILQLTSIIEGAFLPSVGSTAFLAGAIDNTLGTATSTAETPVEASPQTDERVGCLAGSDPRADTNNDGVIDIRDLAFVANRFPLGTKCQ